MHTRCNLNQKALRACLGRKAMGLGRAKAVWKGKTHVWAKAKKEVACQMAKSQGLCALKQRNRWCLAWIDFRRAGDYQVSLIWTS